MSHLYHLNYRLIPRPEGLDKTEARRLVEQEDLGSCDAAILFSIITPEDGSSSTAILSMDGKTGESLDDHELFKAWSIMAHQLSQSTELGEGRRALTEQVFEVIRQALLRTKPPSGLVN